MFTRLTTGIEGLGMRGLAAALLFVGAPFAMAQEAAPDAVLASWLGNEFTVESSTLDDHVPTGGKLTFVFDQGNVVHVCTRTVETQKGPWREDFAKSCAVTMTFTKGTHYCSIDDVKTGNAETLASCHRLRSRDIAMRPARVKGTVELNDLIAFLVQGADGHKYMTILVDSPSRVTEDGVIIIRGKN
jgi:hypothetical protein